MMFLSASFARQKGVDSWYFSVQGLGEYDEAVDHEVTRRSHGCLNLRIAQRQLLMSSLRDWYQIR